MTKKWNVFIAEPIDFPGTTHSELEAAGCKVIIGRPTWKHPGWEYTEDELIEACQDMDAVMGASRDSYTRRFMESVKRLRIISKYGIGLEKIDVKAATDSGVLVANTPVQENIDAVAEHTVALMLGLSKRLSFASRHAKSGKWRDQDVMTSELFGS
jgi:phosphoglycerate dehydrogenase-like enzyme